MQNFAPSADIQPAKNLVYLSVRSVILKIYLGRCSAINAANDCKCSQAPHLRMIVPHRIGKTIAARNDHTNLQHL